MSSDSSDKKILGSSPTYNMQLIAYNLRKTMIYYLPNGSGDKKFCVLQNDFSSYCVLTILTAAIFYTHLRLIVFFRNCWFV